MLTFASGSEIGARAPIVNGTLFAFLAASSPMAAHAAPAAPQVAAGNVSISTTPGRTTIGQTSQSAIVNWRSFSIGTGEKLVVQQPNAGSSLLNRVTGSDPSVLLGRLSANGQVWLVNPNGVAIGQGARIDAGGFFATTARVTDAAFLAGGTTAFSGGTDASIVNLGTIQSRQGDTVLVAHRVDNAGTIRAPNGTAALIAATEFTYTPGTANPVSVAAGSSTDKGGAGVTNSGRIRAANAQLVAADGNMYALAVNQTGVVRATGVKQVGGRILLTADGGTVNVDGKLTARGGTVAIGGDPRAAGPKPPAATRTTVARTAVIDVSARKSTGNGGQVMVWSDQQTDFAGTILGTGGAKGGDGGSAEVSSRHTLNYTGTTDLRTPAGKTGTLLLDPDQATVSAATDDRANGVFNATVLANALQTANVTIDTSTGYGDGNTKFGDIVVLAAVNWTSSNTLTLLAGDNIGILNNLTGGTGSKIVFAPGVSPGTAGLPVLTAGALSVAAGATVTAGTVTIQENGSAFPNGAGNLPPIDDPLRQTGAVTFLGALKATTLDLQLNLGGTGGAVSIANANNAIATLASSVATGTIGGALNIYAGSGDLTVTGTFANVAGAVDIRADGNLTLAPGASVSSNASAGNGDVHAIAGKSFINNAGAGAGAVAVNGTGRFLIYSDAPATTILGNLTAAPVYNRTFAANAPGTITNTGNRVLYSLAPALTFTADNQSNTYGDGSPALTFKISGLVGGDTAAQAFSGTPGLSTTAGATPNAGIYTISTSLGSLAASDFGYKLQLADGTLKVAQATVNFTVGSPTVTYGQAFPSTLATPASTLKYTDTAASLGISVSTPAAQSDVGSYPLTVSITNKNYTVGTGAGTLKIQQAPIDVTIGDFARFYGDDNPSPNLVALTVTGLAFGQSARLAAGLAFANADPAANAGTYAITPVAINSNYRIATSTNGTLTVVPRPIAIKPANVVRYFGDPDPAYQILVAGNGLAPFDTIASVAETGRFFLDGGSVAGFTIDGFSSNAGQHAVTVARVANPNYVVTSVPGVFAVLPRPVTLTVANQTTTAGTTPPANSATVTNLPAGTTLATAFPSLGFATAANGTSLTVTQAFTPATYPLPSGIVRDDLFGLSFPATLGTSGKTPALPPAPARTLTTTTLPAAPTTVTFVLGPLTSASAATQTFAFVVPTNFQSNPNFAVTSVTPGKLTINPSAAALAAAAAALDKANRDKFYQAGNGRTTGAFGLPLDALPALADAIKAQIAKELSLPGASSPLASVIEQVLGHSANAKMTDADLYAFLADLANDPIKKAIVSPALSTYIQGLAKRPPSAFSAADKALAAVIDARMAADKPKLAAAATKAENDWYAAQMLDTTGAFFGKSPPWASFIKTAETQLATDTAMAKAAAATETGVVAGVSLASGAAAGTATGLFLSSTFMPLELMTFGAEVGSAALAVGGPVTMAVVAVAAIVAGGIETVQNAQQQQVFKTLTDPGTPAPRLSGFALTNASAKLPKVATAMNNSILSTAIADILLSY